MVIHVFQEIQIINEIQTTNVEKTNEVCATDGRKKINDKQF